MFHLESDVSIQDRTIFTQQDPSLMMMRPVVSTAQSIYTYVQLPEKSICRRLPGHTALDNLIFCFVTTELGPMLRAGSLVNSLFANHTRTMIR